jgi:hypothetical protein
MKPKMINFATFFETFYMQDSEYARRGRGPLYNQPQSISSKPKMPQGSRFLGNNGYNAPLETSVAWPTKKKKKTRSSLRASSQAKQ